MVNIKSNTSGAALYADDFFNAGNGTTVNNNIASFETWHKGKPAQIFSLLDLSALPLSTTQLVWDRAASAHTTAGTMGEKLNDSGSASNPWATDLGGKTAGDRLKDADDQSFLASVK